MLGIGMSEMVIILAVALLVFGPTKLPEIAKGLAKGLRELRRAGDDLRNSVNLDDDDRPRYRPAARQAPPPAEPAQIPGSELAGTAEAPADDADPHTHGLGAPDAPRWPQPAEGTLAQGALAEGTEAQGALETETAPERTGGDDAEPPEAPPSEAKGS